MYEFNIVIILYSSFALCIFRSIFIISSVDCVE